jgi:hypothetical protein
MGQYAGFKSEILTITLAKNNEPGGKMVWYPREMKRTNVLGVYPSSAGGGLVITMALNFLKVISTLKKLRVID